MPMNQPNEDIPVYLFVGFLEGGKTRFIQETMEDKRFNNGERTLLLVCEEGVEEFDPSSWPSRNVVQHVIGEQEDFNEENLRQILRDSGATRVVLSITACGRSAICLRICRSSGRCTRRCALSIPAHS